MGKPSQYFRAGAGALIVNREGLVLALERADVSGAWQLPQGGLEGSEEPLRAALREVAEETGIPENALELVKACPEPLAYELPISSRSDKTGRGQVLYWFLFVFRGSDDLVDVTRSHESRAWRWMAFPRVIEGVAAFRKPMYLRLAKEFHTYLVTPTADSSARASTSR